jgi:hypothetical protein
MESGMRRLILTLAVTLLLSANGASAAQALSMNPYNRAVEVAVTYWGRSVPCTGMPVVHLTTAPPVAQVSAGPLQNALAKGTAEVEAWVNLNEAATGRCTINLNDKIWNSTMAGVVEFHKLCNTMAHEVGHFLGHEDEGSTNPASITYPEETAQNENSVPGCIHHGYSSATVKTLEHRVLREERKLAK